MSFHKQYNAQRPGTYWYSRGYLPRCNNTAAIQSLTSRLADAVPASKVAQWKQELEITENVPNSDVRRIELRRRISKYEDRGCGQCWLSNPDIAAVVENALFHFDGQRYVLYGWCVMPNHIHVLFESRDGHDLEKIAHSWKSYTAHEINKLLGRTGVVWEREGYDRFVRNQQHFDNVLAYIENNPVAAGLVNEAGAWRFSSASWKHIDI